MTLECKNIDEKLLDFLYEELPEDETAAFREHVAGCARCQAELDSFGRVRTAAKSLALDEPPQAASAKLMYQAAQLVPRGKVLPLFSKVIKHPAFAMAAAFVVVGGFASWQLFNHKMVMPDAAKVAVEAPPAPPSPTVPAVAAPPPAQAAAPEGAGVFLDGKDVEGNKLAAVAKEKAPAKAEAAPAGWVAPTTAKPSPKELAVPARHAAAKKDSFDSPLADDVSVGDTKAAGKKLAPSAPPSDPKWAPPAASPKPVTTVTATPPASTTVTRKQEPAAAGDQVAQRGASSSSSYGELPLGRDENAELQRSLKTGNGAPSTAPRPQSPYYKRADEDNAISAGRALMQEQNQQDRMRDLDSRLGGRTAKGKVVARQAPETNAASQATPSNEEVQQLQSRMHVEKPEACVGVSQTFREMRLTRPEMVTPEYRIKFAHCQYKAGNFAEARKELESLRVDAPSVTGRIDAELKRLESERQIAEPDVMPEAASTVESKKYRKPAPARPAKQAAPAAVDAYH